MWQYVAKAVGFIMGTLALSTFSNRRLQNKVKKAVAENVDNVTDRVIQKGKLTWSKSAGKADVYYTTPDDEVPPGKASGATPYKPFKDDAGYDLYATENVRFAPYQTKAVQVNMATSIDTRYYVEITGRSGMSSKGWLVHIGTVDPGYRGTYLAIMTNLSIRPRGIKKGTRIAQMIIRPRVEANFIRVDDLDESERGDKGLGDSGKH